MKYMSYEKLVKQPCSASPAFGKRCLAPLSEESDFTSFGWDSLANTGGPGSTSECQPSVPQLLAVSEHFS